MVGCFQSPPTQAEGVVGLVNSCKVVVQPNLPSTHLRHHAAFYRGEVAIDRDRMPGDFREEALEVTPMLRLPPGLLPLFLGMLFDPRV